VSRGDDMKVILKQDVKNLGKKDSTLEVSDGYARNFLFAKGLAVEANAVNINLLTNQKQSNERKKGKERDEANLLSEKINKIEMILKTKSGENGKLFGSITSKDISEELKISYGIDIDKRKLELPEPIKSVGTYTIDVKVYTGINTKLKVKVESE
jgi:large subunit ribosomal protein L9